MSSLVREMVAKGLEGDAAREPAPPRRPVHIRSRRPFETGSPVCRLGEARRSAGRSDREVIFLDTSAIYAWADAADPNHHAAVRRLQAVLDAGEELLTHNYVLVNPLRCSRRGSALLQPEAGEGFDRARRGAVWTTICTHPASASWSDRSDATSALSIAQLPCHETSRRPVAFAFDPRFCRSGIHALRRQPHA